MHTQTLFFDELRLLHFLLGDAPDDSGRSHKDVISMTDIELETTHNYIQWLFPIDVRSSVTPNAPVLTPKLIERVKNQSRCMNNVSMAVTRMRLFYNLNSDAPYWWCRPNHNLMRITRIIKCLTLLDHHCRVDFYDDVCKAALNCDVRDARSYWHDAFHCRE